MANNIGGRLGKRWRDSINGSLPPLPPHLFGEVTGVDRKGRRSKFRKHLTAACPRCQAERDRAEERRASVENC